VVPFVEVANTPLESVTATKRLKSGLQHTHALVVAVRLATAVSVQDVPLEEVATAPGPRATNNPNSGLHVTEKYWKLPAVPVPATHVIPSDEYIVAPVVAATAANNPSSGLQTTLRQDEADAAARAIQLMPSDEIITRFVPVDETAQNIPNAGLQHTELNVLLSGVVLLVQVTPSYDVEARIRVPCDPTETKIPNSGLQHTEFALDAVDQ
jgi:hypothetical protein